MSSESSTSSPAVWKAARTNVAVFDLSDRTQIEITGSDRARFLHSFTSGDIKRLKPGQGCESFVTNLKGKVVAHVFVFCTEQSLWLDGTPGQLEGIVGHLGKFLLIDDVQLIPRTAERGDLFVTGPLAAALLQLEGSLAVGGHVTRETEGNAFDIRRVDLLGEPGFLLSIPLARIDAVKLSFRALGIPEGSRELFESLRIEAGYPRYGVDVTDDNLAQEVARTKQCISFDKGCYLGQETIARLDSLGHTNRELRRLQFSTDIVPEAGHQIFDEAGTTELGVVTSSTKNSGDTATNQEPSVLALGYLKRSALPIGTVLSLVIDGKTISGRVL